MNTGFIGSGGKIDVAPGYYRGRFSNNIIEIIGATESGKSKNIHLPVESISTNSKVYDVILVVGEVDYQVYYDASSKNINRVAIDEKNVPVTPEYIKELAKVRSVSAGPAISQLNAILITNAIELSTGNVVYIPYTDFMGDVDIEYLDTVIATFTAKGFYILRSSGNEISVQIN